MASGAGGGRGFLYYSWKGLGALVHFLLRALGLLFLLLILLGVTAYLGLRAAFNEERIRSVFVAQLQDLVHRPVQIDKVLLDPHGFKLRGLRVMERADVPGQYLLTSDTVLVTINIDALLREKRLELDQVRLVGPSIELIRDEAGQWNVSDIFTSTHSARALSFAGFSLPLSIAADLTRIEQGTFKIDDRLKGASHRFEKVELSLAKFSLDQPFFFSVSWEDTSRLGGRTLKSAAAVEGSLSLAGFDWTKASLRARKVGLTVGGVALRGQGSVTGFPPSELELTAELPGLGPEDWRRLLDKELDLRLPAGRWQLRAVFPEPHQVLVKRLSVEAPPLSASAMGLVDLSSATLQGELSVANFPLARTGELYPRWHGPWRGTLSGSISAAGPWGRPELRGGSVKVSGAGGRIKNLQVDGGDLSVSASDNLEKLTFAAEGGQGRYLDTPFSELALSAVLDRDDLKVDRLSVRLLDSRVALSARVRNLADPQQVALAGSIDRLGWEETQALAAQLAARISTPTAHVDTGQPRTWVRTFKYAIPKKFPDTVGHITIGSVTHKNFTFANVDLLWDIRGVSPSLKRVDGDLQVRLGRGHVNDIPAVQASNKFLRIVFLPFIYMHKMNNLSVFSTATAYPKTLDFTRIEGHYGLRQGVATTRLFYVDSPQMVAFADGTADLGKETVDMNIMTRLTTYRATLPEWWVDEKNRAAIAFRVQGDLNLPDLAPRLNKMAADEIEKALASATAKSKKRRTVLNGLRRLGLEK